MGPSPSRARPENQGMLRAQKRAHSALSREGAIPAREGTIPRRALQRTGTGPPARISESTDWSRAEAPAASTIGRLEETGMLKKSLRLAILTATVLLSSQAPAPAAAQGENDVAATL